MRTRRNPSSSNLMSSKRHQPVLLHEAIEALAIKPDSVVFDATVGSGGHAKAIIEKLGPTGVYIGADADSTAIECARSLLSGSRARVVLVHENFRHVENTLAREGISRIDVALFDLGWRSEQLVGPRGFSFMEDGPLLMTYDPRPGPHALTAREIVNTWEEEHIADVLYGWGEERFARKIANAIVCNREKKTIETTQELANIVAEATPLWYQRGRIHPATKTFQALRIAVNDELNALSEGLQGALNILKSGGRVAIITFHSGEDRVVKRFFKAEEEAGHGRVITKKPVTPTQEEIERNPRARSAKLRIFEKNPPSSMAIII